ncbi:MAG: tyrosine-protein phosphatase [Clostridiales bacterium]|jgi:protein-tyrosine phosphatase|nr:tyrosine-protein phosphatase [Clostridiales bacterium]
MNKIINFRDLGGIPLKGGKAVKAGCFYRCAELDFADEGDIAALRALNLKSIFDFRDEIEKTAPLVYGRLGAEYKNVPVRAENAKIIKLRKKPDLETLLSLNGGDVCDVYRQLPFDNPSYKEFFEMIRAGKTPILFHCTAGKDRTGVAAALLLTLLGASRDDVIGDYLKTKKAVPQIRAGMLRNVNFLIRGFIGKRLTPLFEAETAYITAALDAVAQKYDGIEEYFKAEYAYDQSDIDRIRETYCV